MSNPTANFGWVMPDPVDLVTNLPADFEVFGQAVDSTFVDLKGGTTGQVLSKASNADMDFVWSADSAGMTNPMTTTGDTIYSSPGSTPVRLGIGTTGQVLTVASGLPSWATPATGSITQIASGTLSGTSVTISSIPSTYKQITLYIFNIANTTGDDSRIRFNGDTGTVYQKQSIGSNIGYPATSDNISIPYANDGAFAWMNIPNYSSTTARLKLTNGAGGGPSPSVSIWNNGYYPSSAAAISSITMYTNSTAFTGSYILYGVN